MNDIYIENLSSSVALSSGQALAAIIHRFRPDLVEKEMFLLSRSDNESNNSDNLKK